MSAEGLRHLVVAGCGCWWVEYVPADFSMGPDEPRVCAKCRSSHPASVRPSPQGMAMVRVAYIFDAAHVEAAQRVIRRYDAEEA